MFSRLQRLKLLRNFDDYLINGEKKWKILRPTTVLSKKFITTTCCGREKSIPNNSEQTAEIKYGQPTFQTHPHLLKQNEIVIGVTVSEFKERRERLMEAIHECESRVIKSKKNIVIVPASPKKYMTDKIPYVFRQNSDFYYLTGCLEPESLLVMWSNENDRIRSALFMQTKSKNDELWDGPATGVDNAVNLFQVDEAHDLKTFEDFVKRFVVSETYTVWYDKAAEVQPKLQNTLEKLLTKNTAVHSPTTFLHQQRLIKSPAEQNLMRETCRIASEAFNDTIKESRPGDSEHHIFARVDYFCRMRNASFLAYPPVVAAGKNATIIHYINNSQIAQDGDLVLMDAGCEYGGYSSDITRTWPINGSFTPAQEILYEVILALQKDLLALIKKHESITLDDLFNVTILRLGSYLQEVGLIDKSLGRVELAQIAYKFCPHHVSHYLGMDIHDTPSIKRNRPLEPGMVFTIEPGLYIGTDWKDIPEEFRGIGIRIEDDVLYQSAGDIEILTEKCIKAKPQQNHFLYTNT